MSNVTPLRTPVRSINRTSKTEHFYLDVEASGNEIHLQCKGELTNRESLLAERLLLDIANVCDSETVTVDLRQVKKFDLSGVSVIARLIRSLDRNRCITTVATNNPIHNAQLSLAALGSRFTVVSP